MKNKITLVELCLYFCSAVVINCMHKKTNKPFISRSPYHLGGHTLNILALQTCPGCSQNVHLRRHKCKNKQPVRSKNTGTNQATPPATQQSPKNSSNT